MRATENQFPWRFAGSPASIVSFVMMAEKTLKMKLAAEVFAFHKRRGTLACLPLKTAIWKVCVYFHDS